MTQTILINLKQKSSYQQIHIIPLLNPKEMMIYKAKETRKMNAPIYILGHGITYIIIMLKPNAIIFKIYYISHYKECKQDIRDGNCIIPK